MKFDELYKKVINASKASEERQVPIHLDIKIEDLRDALVESNVTIEKLVSAKKSAEQILKNLLDCGLIKEWYFNGKFNAVLKNDDPHLQIAELKAENAQLMKETEFMHRNCRWHAGDGCSRLLGEKLALVNDITELKAKLKEAEDARYEAGADAADYYQENRRLKRALWLSRANSADGKFIYWCARFGVESGFTKADICGYSVNTKRRLRMIREWIGVWKNVRSKCKAKAEEYK